LTSLHVSFITLVVLYTDRYILSSKQPSTSTYTLATTTEQADEITRNLFRDQTALVSRIFGTNPLAQPLEWPFCLLALCFWRHYDQVKDVMCRNRRLATKTRFGAPLTYFHIILLLLYPILYILYIYRSTIAAITRPANSQDALNDT
jgi:hypothetical protein